MLYSAISFTELVEQKQSQLYTQGLEQTSTFLWFLPLEAHAHHTNYTNDCFSGFLDGQMEYSMIGMVGGWILERKTNFFRFIIITPCPGGLHDKRMWLNCFAGGKNVIKDNTPLLSKKPSKKTKLQTERRISRHSRSKQFAKYHWISQMEKNNNNKNTRICKKPPNFHEW